MSVHINNCHKTLTKIISTIIRSFPTTTKFHNIKLYIIYNIQLFTTVRKTVISIIFVRTYAYT